MSKIDDIRKQVVAHLLERHYKEKEAGRDFFFTVGLADSRLVPSIFKLRVKTKPMLIVIFYNGFEKKQISYLLISEKKQVFFILRFDGQFHDELLDIVNELQFYYSEILFESDFTRYVDSQYSPGIIEASFELAGAENFEEKIEIFLNQVKPDIDDIFEPLRSQRHYDYLFMSSGQFEAYLQNEPAYMPSVRFSRTNLALQSFRIQNFKDIRSLVIENLSASARWIVLTGENGYGKTIVLQAIAAGLSGNFSENGQELVPPTAFVGIEYVANGEVVEINSNAPRQESFDKRLVDQLVTYGPSRLNVTASVSMKEVERQLPATAHLFEEGGLLSNIEPILFGSYAFDLNRKLYTQITDLFKQLIPQLVEIKITTNKGSPEVLYIEKDELGNILHNGLPLRELATGFRNIINMIGDMVNRLYAKQDVEHIRDLQGIVIIDEFELHLHPKYQKRLPEILTTQFPHLQFIISTHSPIPLLGIPKGIGVELLHVTRTEEHGISVERLDIDFSVLTPNAILSSPIFGFKDLIPDSKPDDQMVQPEDTYEEVQLDQQIRSQINDFLTPEKQQELLKLITEK